MYNKRLESSFGWNIFRLVPDLYSKSGQMTKFAEKIK